MAITYQLCYTALGKQIKELTETLRGQHKAYCVVSICVLRNTRSESFRYEAMQSATLIRSRPSMTAMSLEISTLELQVQ